MRLIALLSWYDEPTAWLTRCVSSLAQVPVDHVIALDGAYRYYPGAQPQSDPDEATAIRDAARTAGIPCEVHRPVTVWPTEMAKRNRLFEYAERVADPGDWYMVIDADEFVTAAPPDVHARLTATPFDVAAVTLDEPGHPLGTIRYATFPMLFRAIPQLRATGNHYTYTTPDGRKLWGNAKTDRLEPRADLTALTVEHHNQLRHPDRRQAALHSYTTRDTLGIEDLPPDRTILA